MNWKVPFLIFLLLVGMPILYRFLIWYWDRTRGGKR